MKSEIAFMAVRRGNFLLASVNFQRQGVRRWLNEHPYYEREEMGYKIKKVLVTVIDETDDL